MEVVLFDADEERLDLMQRLASVCFLVEDSKHLLSFTADPQEALEGAEMVVMMVGENCARKYLIARHGALPSKIVPRGNGEASTEELTPFEYIGQALTEILVHVPDGAPILSLLQGGEDVVFHSPNLLELSVANWPASPDPSTSWQIPHQILRWIHGDEDVYALLAENRLSPVREWLDNPSPNTRGLRKLEDS